MKKNKMILFFTETIIFDIFDEKKRKKNYYC